MKQKNENVDFLDFGANLLGTMLAGKGVIWYLEGTIAMSQGRKANIAAGGTIRSGQSF